MDAIFDWSIPVILWLQQFSPTLDAPFLAFTFLGEEDFFLILLPLVYWCLDRRTGAFLAILFLSSTYTSYLVKAWVEQPRPFQVDGRVRPMAPSPGDGFPSAHTQNSVVVWGYLATRLRRPWAWAMAGLFCIMVPLSRIYLGVHFPTDLLGGYIIGAGLLLLALRVGPGLAAWLARQDLAWQLGLAVAIPLLLVFVLPTGEETGVTAAAVLLGMGIGLPLERRWLGFEVAGSVAQRGLRLLLGLVVVLALRFGLKAAFAGLEPAMLYQFIRYGVIALWVALGAPWVFVKVGLAKSRAVEGLGRVTN